MFKLSKMTVPLFCRNCRAFDQKLLFDTIRISSKNLLFHTRRLLPTWQKPLTIFSTKRFNQAFFITEATTICLTNGFQRRC